jgi:hypothetical protein
MFAQSLRRRPQARARLRLSLPPLSVAAVALAFAGAVTLWVRTSPPAGAREEPRGPALLPADAAPDLEQRLGKWKPVEMRFQPAGLSARELRLVDKLIDACRQVESIYWRQSDPQALALYKALPAWNPAALAPGSPGPPGARGSSALKRLLWINASRYDLLDDNRPFVGRLPMPRGRTFYPDGLSREEIDAYLVRHPAARQAIFGEQTVIRRRGGELVAVPYHVAYAEFLQPAAGALREAAAIAEEPAFANFLRLRAEALLTDDYEQSDRAWMEMVDPKFDVILAPYQADLDDLLGVKTSYGAAVLIRDEAASAKPALVESFVPDLQDALPLPAADRPSKRGWIAPVEFMDTPFRAGDLRHGVQLVAQVHERRVSKEIFFKNYLDARVREIILPLARRMMRPDQAAKATADGYLTVVMMHEIGHRLGPVFGRRDGRRMDIRAAIGPTYAALEEAKADAAGMFSVPWLAAHGALPKAHLDEYYCSYVAGLFRAVRFGTGEAHGRAQMMELSYLSERGAVERDPISGRVQLDLARMPGALAALAAELLRIEAAADRAGAETWFEVYDEMPPEIEATLAAAGNVPVALDPHDSFGEDVQ